MTDVWICRSCGWIRFGDDDCWLCANCLACGWNYQRGIPMGATKEDVKNAILLVMAVGDCIRDLGSVPSGELYARLMDKMDIRTYDHVIATLKGAKIVEEKNHVLTWVGRRS